MLEINIEIFTKNGDGEEGRFWGVRVCGGVGARVSQEQTTKRTT